MSRFERSIEIACPVERLFAFHLDTRNAAAISPPSQRVVRVDGTFPVQAGDVVGLEVRPALLGRALPVPQRAAEQRRPHLEPDDIARLDREGAVDADDALRRRRDGGGVARVTMPFEHLGDRPIDLVGS